MIYEIAILDLGISDADFWRMTPKQFWRIYYGKLRRTQAASGQLTEEDKERLSELLKQAKDEECRISS